MPSITKGGIELAIKIVIGNTAFSNTLPPFISVS